MSQVEAHCPTLDAPALLVSDEDDASKLICLDAGRHCTNTTCPLTGVPSSTMIHRLERRMKQAATGLELLYQAMIHTAHTRGYGEMYLRIKGVVPPTYNV